MRPSRALLKSPFITPRQLHGSSRVPVDATWFMPNVPRNALTEYQSKRIPGARFFDLDAISDRTSPFPHMFPDAQTFSSSMSTLGIRANDDVCLYDTHGLFSAARAYMTLKMNRHVGQVTLLEGGLPAWEAENLPLEDTPPAPLTPVTYNVSNQDEILAVQFDEITKIVKGEDGYNNVQVLDARPEGRFLGRSPEPRPGLSSGHMPRSTSLAFPNVLSKDGKILPREQLLLVLEEHNIKLDAPIVVSCGTGVTACILAVALETLGVASRVYDESWTGYADPSRAGAMPGMILKTHE